MLAGMPGPKVPLEGRMATSVTPWSLDHQDKSPQIWASVCVCLCACVCGVGWGGACV